MASNIFSVIGMICTALFVILLIAVVIIALRVRRFVKGLGEAMKNANLSGTPATITLVPAPAPTWQDTAKVAATVDEFHRAGFDDIGIFIMPEMPGVQLQAFCRPLEGLYGVVYEHTQAGFVWADVFSRYENGDGITASNAPKGHELDHKPGQTKIYDKHATVTELLEKLRAQRQPLPTVPHTAAAFVALFQQSYAEEMEWRDKRGGPTAEEIQRVALEMGQAASPDQVQSARNIERAQAAERMEGRCLEAFFASGQIGADEGERLRDHIIVVHDFSDVEAHLDDVAVLLRDGENDDFDLDEYLAPHRDKSPREAFRQVVFDLPLRQAYRHLGTVSEPVEADVWVRPSLDDQ